MKKLLLSGAFLSLLLVGCREGGENQIDDQDGEVDIPTEQINGEDEENNEDAEDTQESDTVDESEENDS